MCVPTFQPEMHGDPLVHKRSLFRLMADVAWRRINCIQLQGEFSSSIQAPHGVLMVMGYAQVEASPVQQTIKLHDS